MKMIRLKLWQAILLVFSTISVAAGGVVLYTYLTTGFESEIVKPEGIYFQQDGKYNAETNQFEIDSSFSLTIKATNDGVTEKDVVLSFEKSLSTDSSITDSEITKDGIKYITNGILTVPQNVKIGQAFDVTVNQARFEIEDDYTYYANIGGISTILAKTTDKLDKKEAKTNIAVDVVVDSVRFDIRDTDEFSNKTYDVIGGKCTILQSSSFAIGVNYFPASSKYRYSDNLFSEFYAVEKDVVREKNYCFDSADVNVTKHYDGGDIYFTSNNIISEGNNVHFYVFKSAKEQAKFEAETVGLDGEVYYNAMLSYLVSAEQSAIVKETISFDIKQARVGSVILTNKNFTGMTNKLFKLCVNNNLYGDGTLGLGIANTEGENLASSMISQLGMMISYTKPGEVKKILKSGDTTVVVKGATGSVILGSDYVTNPYLFGGNLTSDTSVVSGKTYWTKTDGVFEEVEEPEGNPNANGYYENVKTYFIINSAMRNLNNANWEISTSEDNLEIEMQIVLFVLDDNGELKIFDQEHNDSRIATMSISSHEDAGIAWQGETSINNTIIHNSDGTKVSAHIDSASKISVPRDNVYQTVRYYVAKSTGDELTTDDVNIVPGRVHEFGVDTYYLASSGDLFFKSAGTYYVRFVTIRTDAYGKVIEKDDDFIVEKVSSVLTVEISETLQPFESTEIIIEDVTANGVFESVSNDDYNSGITYYKNENYKYSKDTTVTESNFGDLKANLFKLDYFALMTGSEDLKLKITVGERDTTMLDTEINQNKRLVVNAISYDGTITIPLSIEDIDPSGKDAILTLKIPDTITISDTDGKGKEFYLQIDYNNTVTHIYTDVEVTDHPKTSQNARQCFMIYSQTPSKIINDYFVKPNKTFTATANVELDENAEYTQCSITYQGDGGVSVNLGTEYDPAITDKEALNKRIEETVILDGYGRKMEKNPVVSVSGSSSSIYVSGNKIEFASGKEDGIVARVSAGNNSMQQEVFYNFVLNTESFGLSKVKVGETEFVGSELSNISETIEGKIGELITLSEFIKVYVGQSVTELGTDKYFVYVKAGNDSNLLDMLSFSNNSAKKSSTTPITTLEILRDFYAVGTLRLYVSNKNYSDQASDAVETINFEVTLNFSSYVTATVNANESQVSGISGNLTDGVYAGYEYSLNDLISLKNKSNPAETISWENSTYYLDHIYDGKTYKILRTGLISETAADSVGTVNSKIYFEDVAEITTYVIRFYYYGSNPYCFFGDVTFKVYPNLMLKKATGTGLDKVNLINLAKGQELAINNYFSTERIRGTDEIKNTKYQRLGENNYTIEIAPNNTDFNFNAASTLDLGYGLYSDSMTIGLYLKGTGDKYIPVKNADGENVTITLDVEVGTSIVQIAKVLREVNGYTPTEDDAPIPGKSYYTYNGTEYEEYQGSSFDGGTTYYEFVDKYLKTRLYDGKEVLFVDSEIGKYEETDPTKQSGIDDGNGGKYYFDIMKFRNSPYDKANNNVWNFLHKDQGIRYGSDIYLYLQVKIKEGGSYKTVAQLKVPIVISGVGLDFVKYTNYVETDITTLLYGGGGYKETEDATYQFGKEYFTLNGVEYKKFTGNSFVAGTTYYEYVDDENYPYEEKMAGQTYQISFDINDVLEEGLYSDMSKDVLTNITFAPKDMELGTLTRDANGKWIVAFANYAGEDRMVSLNVTYHRGDCDLEFTYRILLKANVSTKTIYPIGENSTAEFITVNLEQVYDLSDVFGGYAGGKASETRFNFYLDSTKTTKLDEKKEYFVDSEPTSKVLQKDTNVYAMVEVASKSPANFGTYYVLVDNQYVKASTLGSYNEDEDYFDLEIACTLTNGIRIENYEDFGEGFYHITFFNTTYSIGRITYKENESESSDLYFEEFEDGVYQHIASPTATYYLTVSSANGKKNFVLTLNNETVVANFSLTNDGILRLINMNNAYAVGLEINKTYSSVVGGSLSYNFAINSTNGYYYIDYDGIQENKSQDVTTNFSNEISFDVHFTDNNDLRDTTIKLEENELTKSQELYNRYGQIVPLDDLEMQVNLNKSAGTDGTFTLNITKKAFVDQDYVLVIYFNAKGNRISTLRINIPCSVKESAPDVHLLAGTTLTKGLLNDKFVFKNATNERVDITSFSLNEPYRDIVKTTNEITALSEDEKDVLLKFTFGCANGTFYRDIIVTIDKNVTPVEDLTYNLTYYAGNPSSIDLQNNFYALEDGTSLQGGEFDIEIVNDPTHFPNDGDNSYVILNSEKTKLEFKSTNVPYRIVDETIRVKFTYTYGEDSFTWTTAFKITIEPNTEWVVTYPDPETRVFTKATGEYNSEEEYYVYQSGNYGIVADKKPEDFDKYFVKNEKRANALTGESVFADEEYELFNSKASFADVNRVQAFKTEDNSSLGLNDAVVKIKSKTNVSVVGTNEDPVGSGEYKYYSTFTFKLENSVSNGTVVFTIELNGVVAEYTVYVFENYVEANVVKVAQTADGEVQTIYLETITDGTLFEENMLAKVTMPSSIPTGTYYIKLSGVTNEWVGFNYNANKTDEVYVLIGESVFENQILGIYSSKSISAQDLRKTANVKIELTSFATLKYKTLKNGVVDKIQIGDFVDLTAFEKSQRNSGETSAKTALIKIGEKYYKISASGLGEEVTVTDTPTLYVDGIYSFYDTVFEYPAGTKIYISETDAEKEGFELENIDGLGQIVEKLGDSGYYKFTRDVKTYYANSAETYNVNAKKETGAYKKIVFETNQSVSYSDISSSYRTLTVGQGHYILSGDTNGKKYYVNENNLYYSFTAVKYSKRGIILVSYDSTSGDYTYKIGSNVINPILGEYSQGFTPFTYTIGSDTYTAYLKGNVSLLQTENFDYYFKESESTFNDFKYNSSIETGSTVLLDSNYYYITNAPSTYTLSDSINKNFIAAYVLNEITLETLSRDYIKSYGQAKSSSKISSEQLELIESVDDNYKNYYVAQDPSTLAYYLVESVGNETYFIPSSTANFYKNETRVAEVDGEVKNAVEIDGKDFVKIGDGKYVLLAEDDINLILVNGANYVLANVNTFSINSISELAVGDEIKVTFDYLIEGRKTGSFDVEFNIDVDIDVQDTFDSENKNGNAQTISYYDEDNNEQTINFVELEVNKTYDFNQMIGVVRKSTGNIVSPADFSSTSFASLNIVPRNDAIGILGEELARELDEKGGIKDNSDIVRFAYELVKTGNGEADPVYNFNIRARGTDNDGDFILVKYTYTMNVSSLSFSNENNRYYYVRYILFKLTSDYLVTMRDTENNILISENADGKVTNKGNVGYISDFKTIGEIVEIGSTLETLYENIFGGSSSPEKFDLSSGSEFVYAYGGMGKDTENSSNSQYTAITCKKNNQIYFVKTQYIGAEGIGNDCIAKDRNYGLNVNIIATGTENSLVTVTAQNAVNSLQNLSAIVFKAQLDALTAETDITTYLDRTHCEIDEATNIVSKNTGGLKLRIANDICLGEREFSVTLTDDYGYKIIYYFTLVASSNPTYAKGTKNFTENDYFDIGAMFELVKVSTWLAKSDGNVYVKDSEGDVKFKQITSEPAEPTSYYRQSKDGMYKIGEYESGCYVIDTTASGDSYRVFVDEISASKSSGLNYIGDKVDGEAEIASDSYRIRTGEAKNEYLMDIPKSLLIPKSTSTSWKDPARGSDMTGYKDTIVLTGINAFGYENENISFEGAVGRYFESKSDLDKIKITRVSYIAKNGVTVATETYDLTLASSASTYRYNSTCAIGRNASKEYQIPVLPGWVYEDKDSANVTMKILMKYADEDAGIEETYPLEIPITITKEPPRILTLGATNISDDTTFNLSPSHLKTNEGGSFNYYDDTLAVTLPARGKVDVKVVATKSGEEDLEGTQSIQSNYPVDFTYYIGLSRTVGRTLDSDYRVTVTFSNYDNTKVTREGHFGFYATYNNNSSLSASGKDGEISIGSTVAYLYGYGKTTGAENENVGKYTTITQVVGSNVEADFEKYYVLKTNKYEQPKADSYDSRETYYTYDISTGQYVLVEETNEDDFSQYFIFSKSKYFKASKLEDFNLGHTYYVLLNIPTENVDRDHNIVTKVTSYVNVENFTNEGVKEKSFEITTLAYITQDNLHLTDSYNLSGGKQEVVKYYIGEYTVDNEFYQIVKPYNLYPKYFDFRTTDYNNSAVAIAIKGAGYTSFDFASWANEVLIKHYGEANDLKDGKLGEAGINLNAIYFELGEDSTTQASINRTNGQITVDNSKSKLNGENFIQINIYIKASGEIGGFVDDNLPYSGNMYNRQMITVSVHLKAYEVATGVDSSNYQSYFVRDGAYSFVTPTGAYNTSETYYKVCDQ